jgi:hypothetical protein
MDMDFGEIRAAFMGGEAALRRLDDFRRDRLRRLKAGDGIIALNNPAVLALHLLPLQSFSLNYRPDLRNVTHDVAGQQLLIPEHPTWGWQPHFTQHGFLQICSAGGQTAKPVMYANLFRNAAVEVVDANVLNHFAAKSVTGTGLEFTLFRMTRNLLRLLDTLEVQTPYYVFPSLFNVEGRKLIKLNYHGLENEERLFEMDDLVLPEAVIEDRSRPLEHVFQPVADVLWNACGWSGSPNYDTEGEYTLKWDE